MTFNTIPELTNAMIQLETQLDQYKSQLINMEASLTQYNDQACGYDRMVINKECELRANRGYDHGKLWCLEMTRLNQANNLEQMNQHKRRMFRLKQLYVDTESHIKQLIREKLSLSN